VPVQADLLGDIMNLLTGGGASAQDATGTASDFQNWTNYYLLTKPGFYVNATAINYTLPDFDTPNFTYQIEVETLNWSRLYTFALPAKKATYSFNLALLPSSQPVYIRLIARNKDSVWGGVHWCEKKTNASHWLYIEEIKEYQCPISHFVDVVLIQNTDTFPAHDSTLDILKDSTPYKNESIPGASWAARWKIEGT